MKNILFVVEDMKMGGVQRVTGIIADALNLRGYQAGILALRKKEVFDNLNSDVVYQELAGEFIFKIFKHVYNIFKTPPISVWYYTYLKKINKYIKKTKVPDVIILIGGLTMLAPKIREQYPSIRIIAWQHNNAKIYLQKYFLDYQSEFEKGLAYADEVICLTHMDANIFRKYNKKTSVIYNPITICQTTRDLHCTLNAHVIAFVGRLDMEHKGIDLLVEIAMHLPDGWVIKVAGDGNDKETFLNLLDARNLFTKVQYVGVLSKEELIDFYSTSSIYIMTSRWEGMPLSLVDALAFGLPCIAFSQSGSNEILRANGNNYGILIDNLDINKFSEILISLCHSLDKRNYFSVKSKERSKQFELDTILNKWCQLLK